MMLGLVVLALQADGGAQGLSVSFPGGSIFLPEA